MAGGRSWAWASLAFGCAVSANGGWCFHIFSTYLNKKISNQPKVEKYKPLLEVMVWSTIAINKYWRIVYSAPLWLTKNQASELIECGWAFTAPWLWWLNIYSEMCKSFAFYFAWDFFGICLAIKDSYATLARMSAQLGHRLFRIRPKLHMFCHLQKLACYKWFLGIFGAWYQKIFAISFEPWSIYIHSPPYHPLRISLQHQLQSEATFCLNPATWTTWQDEDYIGRIARISRMTAPATTAVRTITRALTHYRRLWGEKFDGVYMEPTGSF